MRELYGVDPMAQTAENLAREHGIAVRTRITMRCGRSSVPRMRSPVDGSSRN